MRGSALLLAGMIIASAGGARAQGGPPLITDDPGTPGPNGWEVNVAYIRATSAADHHYELPLFDVNYGVGEHVQLKVEGPYERDEPADGPGRRGFNNVTGGVKWRFLSQGHGGSPIDMSTYPQVELDRDGAPEYIAPLEVARAFGRLAANVEAGTTWDGRRPGEWFYGVALGIEPSEVTELVGELHSNTERAGGTETFLNAGLREHLSERFVLLAAAGHSLAEPAGEPGKTLTYLGISYISP